MKNPLRRSDLVYTLLLPFAWGVAWWMIEQSITTTNGWTAWVQSWPEELAWIGIGMGFAFLALEPFLERSRSRALLERWNTIADHKDCWWDQAHGDPLRREVYSRLVFKRSVRKLEIRTWAYITAMPPTLIEDKEVRAIKGDAIRLQLATIPILATGWGPRFGDENSKQTFGETDPKLVVIVLRSGLRKQTFKVMLNVFAPSPHFQFRQIAEENSPFEWPKLLAGRT